MNFRSVAQLSDQLLQWSKILPPEIELVVGLPRSGLLAANLLALYRNVPLTDLDGLLAGRCFGTGHTRPNGLSEFGETSNTRFLDSPRAVLVLDDSIQSGETLRRAKARIESAALPHRVIYGAVYVTPETTKLPDHYCEVLRTPRAFEWNILHHPWMLRQACLDMDGVLCVDPRSHENDDSANYQRFVREARPLHRPSSYVHSIVTSRLEKYRSETEAWLHNQGIEYGDLIMMNYPDGATRRRMQTHSAHKAAAYRDSDAVLFIESDLKQAVEISALAKKDVLCVDTMQMIRSGMLPIARPGWPLDDIVKAGNTPSLSKRIARRVLPRPIRHRARRLVSERNGISERNEEKG